MFATTESDRFSQFSVLSFDVSIADLFLCWKSGATLYVPAESDMVTQSDTGTVAREAGVGRPLSPWNL